MATAQLSMRRAKIIEVGRKSECGRGVEESRSWRSKERVRAKWDTTGISTCAFSIPGKGKGKGKRMGHSGTDD